MAYFQTDEEQNKKGSVQTAEAGGRSAPGSAGGAGAANAPAQKASGSGWTNLQSYQEANKGASERLGQGIAGGMNKAYEDKAGDINNAALDQIQGIQSNLVKAPEDSSYFQDATKIDKADFQSKYNADLNRDDFAFQAPEVKNVDNYKSMANQGQAGNKALLSEFLGGGRADYSGGQQSLDSYLLGSGQGRNLVQNTAGNLVDRRNADMAKAQGNFDSRLNALDARQDFEREKFQKMYSNQKTIADQALQNLAGGVDLGLSRDEYMSQGEKAFQQAAALAALTGQNIDAIDFGALYDTESQKMAELAKAKEDAAAVQDIDYSKQIEKINKMADSFKPTPKKEKGPMALPGVGDIQKAGFDIGMKGAKAITDQTKKKKPMNIIEGAKNVGGVLSKGAKSLGKNLKLDQIKL